MARRHVYDEWRVTSGTGKTLATGFKTELAARQWKRTSGMRDLSVRSTRSYSDCAKVVSGDPKRFCGPCANKVPLTGEAGF